MRSQNSQCLLCEKNRSDKKNSHIIPKFLTKSLFGSGNKREGHKYVGNKIYKRVFQDSPKENYIFCSICEDYFSYLERRSSQFFLTWFESNVTEQDLKNVLINGALFKYYLPIDVKIFHLFFYSLVFRVAISNSELFRSFRIPLCDLELLRSEILKFHSVTESQLDKNLTKYDFTLSANYAIFRCINLPEETMGSITAVSFEYVHLIHLNNYMLHLDLGNGKPKDILFQTDELAKIAICSFEYWHSNFVSPVLKLMR